MQKLALKLGGESRFLRPGQGIVSSAGFLGELRVRVGTAGRPLVNDRGQLPAREGPSPRPGL